ncbi:MAG: DUF2244 domain-containing protein [Pseudomonadota bacterium]
MAEFGETIYFDAKLTPNRSLSSGAFTLIMAAFGVTSLTAGLLFFLAGAAPVIGFFGLDALLVWLAFRAHFRKQSVETRVRVTAETVDMRHTAHDGVAKTASIPTAFARVELERPLTYRSHLRVEHGQTAYVIGKFLTVDERADLADALHQAIQAARRETLSA